MKPWYEIYTERYDTEISELEQLGVRYTIDQDLKAQEQILRLDLEIDGNNKAFGLPEQYADNTIRLIAVFPDLYPYFRPDVYAPELDLPRHQNPFMKNLCLIPRESRFWDVETTLAKLLTEQLRQVLVKGNITDAETIQKDETEQAEPWSEYYSVQHRNPIIFDPVCFKTDFTSGVIEQLGKVHISTAKDVYLPTKMIVVESFDMNGKSIGKLPTSFEKLFLRRIEAPIYSIPSAPPTDDASETIKWVSEQLAAIGKRLPIPKPVAVKGNIRLTNVIGLTFEEESAPGVNGQGWLFIVQCEDNLVAGSRSRIKKENKVYYAKVARIDKKSIGVRIPRLESLSDKIVVVVGAGAIGGPSAIEFAKAGVKELRILDNDVVEAATTVRWPLGIMSAGEFKVVALKSFIDQNYPTVTVTPFVHRIAMQRHIPEHDTSSNGFEREYLDKVFDGASLIYDATAELGVMQYLSEEAKKRNLPYIYAHATEGAIGGVVTRVVPNTTDGCWMCLQWKFYEGEIPTPPFDESGRIQPVGCGDFSFTGTSFDLANVYITGVRLAISTLTEGIEGGYPPLGWDVGILSLTDGQHKAIPPTWKTYTLTKHDKCCYCGKQE